MLPLTRHGLREMLIGSALLAVLAVVLLNIWWPLALVVVPVWIWLLAFFRDPERAIPDQPHIMVSPADGRVSDITELPHCELVGGPAVRVGIFLSVFNVHINRAPCDGRVASVVYRKGRFINAMSHNQASEQNESNTVVLLGPTDDRPIAAVKQIVGLIARRIVCTVKVGDIVTRGERIGMIKFGSRTELYVPLWVEPRIEVRIGQAVRGGMDVIAVLGNPPPAAAENGSAAASNRRTGSVA